ncbi:MAG TPA: exodeoxyribonuclease III [Bacteroidales bacterium]|jgi:exodeoxyribonuclease III|nr:exodeoxyribonuclease III [Bacteroidales bacterium]HBZ20299.1 exodeoxyribonuclease III [Bacteroidales bacterium]
MKILSWNVNGIRAIAKKTFFKDLELIDYDILCLQEIKAQENHVTETLEPLNDYYIYSNSAERPGYSGTAVISKIKPLNVTRGINIKEHDTEGRVLCLEFELFFLVNVYVPNSGSELKRLEYRKHWDISFYNYLKEIERVKPVIVCGDLNVAHKEIDLAHPKANYNKTAGYMQEEIDGMNRLINGGFTDTFRSLYPAETERYTWWSYRAGVRSKNIGWRIDYFLVSQSFYPSVKNAFILEDITGSDHCPVGIILQ